MRTVEKLFALAAVCIGGCTHDFSFLEGGVIVDATPNLVLDGVSHDAPGVDVVSHDAPGVEASCVEGGAVSDDPLLGTYWNSTTVPSCGGSQGYASASYDMRLNADHTFSATWTVMYSASSPQYPNCYEVTTVSAGTWSDTVSPGSSNGTFTVSGAQSSTDRICNGNPAGNVTGMQGVYTGAINGGTSQFSRNGYSLTVTGNSVIPIDNCGTWVFVGGPQC